MKKVLCAILGLTSLLGYSQLEIQPMQFEGPIIKHEKFAPIIENGITLKTYGAYWYNTYEDLVDVGELIGSTADNPFWGMVLFPDSTIYQGFTAGNEPIPAYTHGAAEVINPYYTPSGWLEWQNGEVIVDSVAIWYSYERNTASNIVDTLFVEYIADRDSLISFTKTLGLDVYYFAHALVKYDYNKNRLADYTGAILRRDTVLLDESFGLSSGSIGFIELDAQDTLTELDNYGVYVTFQPGYTWTANNDTLENYNAFSLISREQFDGEDAFPLWDINSLLGSYIVPTDIRYNNAGSSNGILWPTTATGSAYPFEHHYIWFKFESQFLSTQELKGGVSELTAFPNPAGNLISVKYTLDKDVDGGGIRLLDLHGRTLQVLGANTLAGTYQFELDLSLLESGNYLISVNGNVRPITVVR